MDLARFSAEKVITFVPPDGEFELMKYRVSDDVQLPFKARGGRACARERVRGEERGGGKREGETCASRAPHPHPPHPRPQVLPLIREVGRSRVEVAVKVSSRGFGEGLAATNVVIRIPVPTHTARCSISLSSGKAKYKAEGSCLVWKIKRFPGQAEVQLTADVELSSTLADKKVWNRPPINMEFAVPMFASRCATGAGVRERIGEQKQNTTGEAKQRQHRSRSPVLPATPPAASRCVSSRSGRSPATRR